MCFEHKSINFLVIYRPPSGSQSQFREKFVSLLDDVYSNSGDIIVTGDFNIHMDNPNNLDTKNFTQVLADFGLISHVSGPTHIGGHTLDLVITRQESTLVKSVRAEDIISDHLMLCFTHSLHHQEKDKKTTTSRSFKDFAIDEFESDLKQSELCVSPADHIDDLVTQYNETISLLLDKHAPVTSATRVKTRKTRWYTQEIHAERQKQRLLTRKWRKSRSEKDNQNMICQRNKISDMIHAAKSEYYHDAITKARKDSKELFRTFRQLFNDVKINPMPPSRTSVENANDFNKFFIEKNQRLKTRFVKNSEHNHLDTRQIDQSLTHLQPITKQKAERLILAAPSKTCALDPAPTHIVKSVASTISPVIQKIIYLSLAQSKVPTGFKTAIVKPLLKKPDLDLIHKNYRPVSNLAFVSKLLEQSVINELEEHFEKNDLNDEFQSAYRSNHSTETALLHIVNDILISMDNRRAICVVMLDLSAAFDTLDHDILIERLSNTQGLGPGVTDWLNSYLRGRIQRVNIDEATSGYIDLLDGAVQGSKLGCRLYKKYVEPLGNMLKHSDCDYHGYADDNTIWKSVNPRSPSDINAGLTALNNTIEQTRNWMYANKLCLNDSKTEFIVFGLNRHISEMPECSFKIGEEIIQPVKVVKNLGVLLDMQLNFRLHISNVVRVCRYHIRRTWFIRRYLTEEAAKRIMLATVTCRLDYCNSLLINLPNKDIERLQKVQNAAARLISRTPKSESAKPVLKRLHWLPIAYRIKFKIAVIIHRCLHDTAPSYLKSMLTQYVPTRNLRSSKSSAVILVVPRVNQKTVGNRAFSVAGPAIWNALPTSIREIESTNVFKSKLKTHYFNCAF